MPVPVVQLPPLASVHVVPINPAPQVRQVDVLVLDVEFQPDRLVQVARQDLVFHPAFLESCAGGQGRQRDAVEAVAHGQFAAVGPVDGLGLGFELEVDWLGEVGQEALDVGPVSGGLVAGHVGAGAEDAAFERLGGALLRPVEELVGRVDGDADGPVGLVGLGGAVVPVACLDEGFEGAAVEAAAHDAQALAVAEVGVFVGLVDDELFGRVDGAFGDDVGDVAAVEGAGPDGPIVGGGHAHVRPEDAVMHQGDVDAVGELLVGNQGFHWTTFCGAVQDAARVGGVVDLCQADVEEIQCWGVEIVVVIFDVG